MSTEKKGISVNIGTNNGTMNISEGDINSNNIVNTNNGSNYENINDIIKQVLEIIRVQEFDSEVKDKIIDDIETIQEEIDNGSPRKVKLTKAKDNIVRFLSNIPSHISKVTLIVSGLNKLIDEVQKL